MNRNPFRPHVFLVAAVMLAAVSGYGQIRSHEIGRLWDSRFQVGTLPEYAPLQDQMTYPGGDYFYQMRKNLERRGLWIGVMDWTDRFGLFHPYYVSEGGPTNFEALEYLSPISNVKYFRNRLPTVKVNGATESRLLDWRSGKGISVSASLPADEHIRTVWTTDVGITVTLNSYAFASRDHDSYHILEHVLKNTGNADKTTSTIELPDQNLKGVYFGFIFSMVPCGDIGHEQMGGEHDDWAHYVGNQPGDTLRGLWYVYDGDSQRKNGDDVGDPSDISGEFLSPQFVGAGIIHCDAAYNDETDDRNQPSTVNFWPRARIRSHTKGDAEQTLYSELSSGTQSRGTDTGAFADPWNPEIQGPVVFLSFGPFDIPFGEDVRIVIYNAVGMIDRKKAIEYGQKWKNGTLEYQGLTGDEAKNAIIATGRDTLMMFASRAEHVWREGLETVPDGPPSPSLDIDSGPGKVELRWTPVDDALDPDTGEPDFAGYRIYRAEDYITNEYRMIWECGGSSGNPVELMYIDREVDRGQNYFYYVTAYDNDGYESSHYYNRNYQYAAVPFLGARNDLDSVLVVPNPFHAQGHAYGGTLPEDYIVNFDTGARTEDRITFVGLPAKAVIRIFTMHGDLVATLEHPNPVNPLSIPESSDEAFFQISDSWQTMKSGVYLYHVEGWDLEGKFLGTTSGKFIVIR